MKEFWIRLDDSLTKEVKENVVKVTNEFCTAYVIESSDEKLFKELGAKLLVSPIDGDVMLFKHFRQALNTNTNRKRCVQTKVRSGKDEKRIAKLAEAGIEYIIAKCEDWKVIPLENLITNTRGKSKLLASVSSASEAALALEALEIGVDGILVEISDIHEIMKIYEIFTKVATKSNNGIDARFQLVEAKVTQIKPLYCGARACIDTCDLMRENEGMLVGCQSSGLFLVQAETLENPFVTPRPFRVNAGSTAQYLLVNGGRTKYLSEVKAGDEVLIINGEGKSRITNVCRTKIEWRPLLLIEAERDNRALKVILQNAETIRLATKNGSKSIKELAKGDVVLVHIQEGGRHFGKVVKEERVIEQ